MPIQTGLLKIIKRLKYQDYNFSYSTNICQIENNAFFSMNQLKTLNLDAFDFEEYEITKDSFKGLSNLENLIISRLNLNLHNEGLFSNLRSLKVLDINISGEINSKHFTGLSDLVELTITKDFYLDYSEDKISFENLINLKILRIKLKNIRKNLFKGLINLKELHLTAYYLNSIEQEAFFGLNQLKKLDLSYSILNELQSNTFSGLVNLKHLNLEGSKCKVIEQHAFRGLFNLELLNLSKIGIDILHEQVFEDLKNLRTFNCFNFSFKEQELTNPFKYFEQLESIHADSNLFEDKLLNMIPEKSLINIKQISLSGENKAIIRFDKLSNLRIYYRNKPCSEPFVFKNLTNLEHLCLTGISDSLITEPNDLFINLNKLTHLNLSCNNFNVDSSFLNGLPNLKYLNLSYTKTELNSYYFRNLSNLEVLDLSSTYINDSQLDEFTFYDLSNLKELYLRYNKRLRTIKSNIFKNMVNLINFDLKYCDIKTIDLEAFDGLSKLQFLDLSKNHIEEMSEQQFKVLVSLKQLKLYGNPFIYRKDVLGFYKNLNIKDLDLVIF